VSRHRRLDGDEVQGLRDVLGCQTSLVCVGLFISANDHHGSTQCFLFVVRTNEVFKIPDCLHSSGMKLINQSNVKIVVACNIFMAKLLLHRRHRRACAGACVFVVVGVACPK